jgi:hypothetical protein
MAAFVLSLSLSLAFAVRLFFSPPCLGTQRELGNKMFPMNKQRCIGNNGGNICSNEKEFFSGSFLSLGTLIGNSGKQLL